MASRLSSILVQEGLLKMEALKEVLALQVIKGGALDTLLLEKKLLSESQLTGMLAKTTGFPPLQPHILAQIGQDSADHLPQEAAEKLQLCPVSLSEGTLTLLVCEAVDQVALEELAYELNQRLLPYVAPAARILQGQQLAYGVEIPSRYQRLLKRLGEVPLAPMGGFSGSWLSATPRSTAIEPRKTEDPFPGSEKETAAVEPDEITLVGPPIQLAEIAPPSSGGALDQQLAIAEPDEITLVGLPLPLQDEAEPDEITHAGSPVPVDEQPAPPAIEEYPSTAEAISLPVSPPTQIKGQLEEEAILAIRQAQSRDELLIAVLRAVNQYLECAQVYVTKQGQLQGHLELSSGHLDNVEIRNRRLSLGSPSIISRSVEDGSVFIGPAPSTDASTTTLLAAGVLSLNGLVLVPIVMKQKTVCLVVGHNYDQPISTMLRPLLMQLSHESALALAELIQRQKASPKQERRAAGGGKREAPVGGPAALRASTSVTSGTIEAPVLPVAPALSSPQSLVEIQPATSSAPATVLAQQERVALATNIPLGGYPFDSVKAVDRPVDLTQDIAEPAKQEEAATAGDPGFPVEITQPGASAPVAVAEAPAMDLFFLLDELERDDELGQVAEERLLKMGTTALQALLARFPGRLRFNRYAPQGELPPAGECSALLRCLKRFGRQVLLGIPPLLHHRDVDVRFYATYLMSELLYPEAVSLVASRLQDRSPEVRRIAGQILRHFQELDQFPAVLLDLRDDLKNPNPRPRKAAAAAIAALGDAGSVPALIELLEDPEVQVAEAAGNALVSLTKQDFAQNSRRWQLWWEEHCHQHRLEWLMDSLLHKAPELRASAAAELEEITELTLGYRFDLEPSEREAIRSLYLEWWSQSGAKLFAT